MKIKITNGSFWIPITPENRRTLLYGICMKKAQSMHGFPKFNSRRLIVFLLILEFQNRHDLSLVVQDSLTLWIRNILRLIRQMRGKLWRTKLTFFYLMTHQTWAWQPASMPAKNKPVASTGALPDGLLCENWWRRSSLTPTTSPSLLSVCSHPLSATCFHKNFQHLKQPMKQCNCKTNQRLVNKWSKITWLLKQTTAKTNNL
jgi:hypothetical protein